MERPAIFPYKRGGTADTTTSHSFCVRAFLCALASEASLGTLIPKRELSDGIPLLALASEASLGTLIPKRELSDGITLIALASEVGYG